MRPACPLTAGGRKPGSAVTSMSAVGRTERVGGRRPARPEHDRDVVPRDAGALGERSAAAASPARPDRSNRPRNQGIRHSDGDYGSPVPGETAPTIASYEPCAGCRARRRAFRPPPASSGARWWRRCSPASGSRGRPIPSWPWPRPPTTGSTLQPLYTADDLPADFVWPTAAATPARAGTSVSSTAAPMPARVNEAILADLENGATSIWLTLGPGGLAVGGLARVTRGRAARPRADRPRRRSTDGGRGGRALLALAGAGPGDLTGSLGLDPIGLRARTGASGRSRRAGRDRRAGARSDRADRDHRRRDRLPRRRRQRRRTNSPSPPRSAVAYVRGADRCRLVGRRRVRDRSSSGSP